MTRADFDRYTVHRTLIGWGLIASPFTISLFIDVTGYVATLIDPVFPSRAAWPAVILVSLPILVGFVLLRGGENKITPGEVVKILAYTALTSFVHFVFSFVVNFPR